MAKNLRAVERDREIRRRCQIIGWASASKADARLQMIAACQPLNRIYAGQPV